jgi:hypothetical protein
MFVTSRLFGDKSQHQRVGRDAFSFAGIKKGTFDLYLIVSVIWIALLFGIAFWGRISLEKAQSDSYLNSIVQDAEAAYASTFYLLVRLSVVVAVVMAVLVIFLCPVNADLCPDEEEKYASE